MPSKKAKITALKQMTANWQKEPVHRIFLFRVAKADVNQIHAHQWLHSTGLKTEAERFNLLTAKSQKLRTKKNQTNIGKYLAYSARLSHLNTK